MKRASCNPSHRLLIKLQRTGYIKKMPEIIYCGPSTTFGANAKNNKPNLSLDFLLRGAAWVFQF